MEQSQKYMSTGQKGRRMDMMFMISKKSNQHQSTKIKKTGTDMKTRSKIILNNDI